MGRNKKAGMNKFLFWKKRNKGKERKKPTGMMREKGKDSKYVQPRVESLSQTEKEG